MQNMILFFEPIVFVVFEINLFGHIFYFYSYTLFGATEK